MPKNVICKKCNNLVNGWCEKVIDSPAPDMVRDCRHFWEKTNADRIRAMPDEELEKAIGGCGLCGYIQDHYQKWCDDMPACTNCVVQWLKQPAKEGE